MSLLAGVLTLLAFLLLGQGWLTGMSGLWAPLGLFLWLFAAMLWLSFSVVHHADCLAIKLGEPYGTLILTLSVISIEVVMISAIMLTGSESPGVGRDMMFAVLMIVLNGLVGLSLLCGSLRHLEQAHNLQGANIFLAVLLPLAVLGLVLPNVTQSTEAGTYSNIQMLFAILASISLYGAFLAAQTLRHRGHFVAPGEDADSGHDHGDLEVHSTGFHAVMLLANMLPIVLLSKSMAKVIDYGIDAFAAPVALGGVVIAILVLAPEGMAAVNAALSNQLQRSINICLGSALATIGMTIPAILIIGLSTGTPVVLGLEPVETVMLFATILASLNTFASNRTTVVHGVVHLVLFFAYLLMVFD
ncbi:calcium:proton antiporter [Ferrimonas marina]|uniref:Ca2+:H+ antiporter n=1 Tax=Ferrimonas marina TaxID=299255 RepID=A0A1M5RH63_9GAMM|nr:calcium:proton antiporter [Ferrimonas marina]SHH25652.1 Ca2+:H+ antiporter [Ferrimonas marina]